VLTIFKAQENTTLMKLYNLGTCNTNIAYQQCQANMNWFATTLKTACEQELRALNTMAVNTLIAYVTNQIFKRECRIVIAVISQNCRRSPSCTMQRVLWTLPAIHTATSTQFTTKIRRMPIYYGLPLGIKLPKTSTPTCSACTKSVMGLYSSALKDPVQASLLTGLHTTYEPSAALSVQLCGAGFAQTNVVNAAMPTLGQPSWILGTLAALFSWVILASAS